MERERAEYDVVIVGAGPSGLAAALRLRQLAGGNESPSVCVVEKGAEVGAHILSGAVLEPRALDELIPDWAARGAPVRLPVTRDRFAFLTARRAWDLPLPPAMDNGGNHLVSLGSLCRWLAQQAEALGADIFPGQSAAGVLHDDGAVAGIVTGDLGLDREGKPKPGHQGGMELRARQTMFAEGCRGSLTKTLAARFGLGRNADPQTHALGIKEVWEIAPERSTPGSVLHTVGWPLDARTYGGSFLYHLDGNRVSVGLVVGLDYANPYLSPFEEMQRFKTHPAIRPVFAGGRRIAYGARTLVEGGFQSIPELVFPGGLLIGDAAGFINVPKLKGIHAAMKTGMVAAEAVHAWLQGGRGRVVADYPERLRASWLWDELYRVRNIRPGFHWGLYGGLLHAAIDAYVLRGKAPWTLHHRPDHQALRPASRCHPIAYPPPDGELTFDRASSVYLSNTNHEADQPCHLRLRDAGVPVRVNLARYDAPEQRYCPAGVYEIEQSENGPHLRINAQNCLHCKACDIKDPTQNIDWTTPEGGGGPNYSNM